MTRWLRSVLCALLGHVRGTLIDWHDPPDEDGNPGRVLHSHRCARCDDPSAFVWADHIAGRYS